jgi:hypothetical protein
MKRTSLPTPDLWPVIAPHAGHRIELVLYGVFGIQTRVMLLCKTCGVELADRDLDTGEETP